MTVFWIIIGILAFLAAAILIIAYICFYITFYEPRNKKNGTQDFILPSGDVYEPYRELIAGWVAEARTLPYEEMETRSFDGLVLHGKYYECAPGAPIELMFHGYRGSAERDLSGGIQRCFAVKHNALIVDQRTSGKSGGKVISFGINESRDCETWLRFMVQHFGEDIEIILTGISMGAATVMMAAARNLPKNVRWILADCGYTSPKAIILKTIREMKLPPRLSYSFVRLGARLYGRFDLEELSPIEAMKQCTVPVIFIHGEADDYVPCAMSIENYEACAAPKKLLTVPGAGHGLAYPVDPEGYLEALRAFETECVK